MQLKILINYGE